jgi:lipid II isoglutaminyl synthase (glutamine-hydrolysing)
VDRTAAAVVAAKAARLASRRLGRGGGTALPGLLAERIEPRLVARMARRLGRGSAIVTGTNGKTTTSRMLAGILSASGAPVIHNRSGSNLMRGLAATLTEAGGLNGSIPNAARTAGVFEVDEATVPPAASAIHPRVITFTNLFRDQLDRYGEVDSITALWRRAVIGLPPHTTLVLNTDDPSVAALRHDARGPVLTFGVEDAGALAAAEAHPADSRWCGICGTEFSYRARFFWHIGHWSCPGCDDRRPAPDVAATRIDAGAERTRIELALPSGSLTVELPLEGLYNVYNALAAAATAVAMDAPVEAIRQGLESFSAAFGRQETLHVRGREARVLLCKNPAGVNQVLRTILASEEPLHLLLILNDDIADGRDVSWIWDVDFELLAGRAATVIAAGTRAADMALRLKYAGLDASVQLEEDVRTAIARALSQTPPGARLHVLPTYTAMLTAREHLAALAGQSRFWKQ